MINHEYQFLGSTPTVIGAKYLIQINESCAAVCKVAQYIHINSISTSGNAIA
ncbi:MAG: hypothetical protein HYX60_05475 [Legionella longbeachae]|nr:hypothetical protein [Legionella longbeachae]